MIFPNADPKKTAYLLNLNNQLNENDKENLTLNIMDFDFNKPSGGGEIKTKQTYPFPVGQEIYIAIEEKKGFADYYRIYRFKALLFLVDRITISLEDNETIERYEAIKGKDLFSTGDAKPKTFITEKESISYVSQVYNLADILLILFNRWDNQIPKKRFDLVLFRFIKTLHSPSSLFDFSDLEKFYEKLKFH